MYTSSTYCVTGDSGRFSFQGPAFRKVTSGKSTLRGLVGVTSLMYVPTLVAVVALELV
jgi:hypothetical protein